MGSCPQNPSHLEIQILNLINLIYGRKSWERERYVHGVTQMSPKKKLLWKQIVKLRGNCNSLGEGWWCLTQGGANEGGKKLTDYEYILKLSQEIVLVD